MIRRMPVARGEDWQASAFKGGNVFVKYRDNLVAARHRERTAGQKIILHVDDNQCVAASWLMPFATYCHLILRPDSSHYRTMIARVTPIRRTVDAALTFDYFTK